MSVAWRPRKPRLHCPSRVRVPKAPLRNGALNYAAACFRRHLFGEKENPWDQIPKFPPSLAAVRKVADEKRAPRCDGLESIWTVVYCLLAFMSIKSYRVGYRLKKKDLSGHDLVGITVERIARWCGLDDSTVSHVLTLLRRAGYLHGPSDDGVNHINQPWEKKDGGFKPLPAIRRFTFVFFAEIGVGSLINQKRAGQPAPEAPKPTVHPDSTTSLITALKNQKALDGPPDG